MFVDGVPILKLILLRNINGCGIQLLISVNDDSELGMILTQFSVFGIILLQNPLWTIYDWIVTVDWGNEFSFSSGLGRICLGRILVILPLLNWYIIIL